MRAVLLLWILFQTFEFIGSYDCPQKCKCRTTGAQAEWLKARCVGAIEDIKDVDINAVSVALFQLDLSKNEIYLIQSGVFRNLTNLRRLNLSSNKISFLEEEAFGGLQSLERLDLSKNNITTIDTHAFRQLTRLKRLDLSANIISTLDTTLFHDLLVLDRLKLNQNDLTTLKDGTFHGLNSLTQLDLSGNPWVCDCGIYWFSNWIRNSSINLSPTPKCSSPDNLKGQPMKKLRVSEEIQCQLATPTIEMIPDQNQVVFAGDSIHLKCRAPGITEDKTAKLNWLWNPNATDIVDNINYTDPRTSLPNITIENRHLTDSGIVDSLLSIIPVKEEHNGQWNCQLVSLHRNKSKTINMIVISENTRYCPLAATRNNKGVYAWPRTVIGWKVELPCEGNRLSGPMQVSLKASYRCNKTGQWENLNTESCPYVSHTTKVLEQFSKVNLSLTKGSLLETAKSFKNYTMDSRKLTDPVEINFITLTIENYLHFLVQEKELCPILIEIVNVVMKLPKEMLKIAEVNYGSCTRLIKAVETVIEFTPSIQSHKKNMALEEIRVRRETFTGLTCTWYSSSVLARDSDTRLLHCATNNKTALINTKDKVVEASIQLPSTLLRQLDVTVAHQLMISMYSDNRLFPIATEDSNMDISSCVIGSKLIGVQVANLTEPVYVTLKAPIYHYSGSQPRPVVWDSGDSKGWTSDGCHLSYLVNNLIVFHCNRLGYYGLLQDTSFLKEETASMARAKFRYSHPAIYVGSFIATICLTCACITYMVCHASILMPKKVKHCLVNTWVAMVLLCLLYTVGIQQTENIYICQSIGLTLHYLSLCSLLWMSVSASNMYKRLSKSDVDVIPEDELPDQPIQKPLLGLYLVGWGIALIICGISGAINLREYASYNHCFLSSGPALAALFVPALILVIYLIIFHLLIRCAIRNIDLNAQLSEGTQATENMDLELLEPNVNAPGDRNSLHSTQTVSSEVEDLEHSQITQLKGQVVVLILYLITWLLAASALTRPLIPYITHEKTILSIMYAISASSLGLFILFFYGIARSDVRFQWLRMRCWLKKKKNRCCRTRSVSDTHPVIPTQPLVQSLAPVSNSQATQVISDTNSNNSSRHTNKSRNSNLTRAVDLNAMDATTAAKIANVNLVVLHRQQYRSNNSVTTYTEPTLASVEMFYNPHQSGVARKFFKKQRRHMKNNNLGPRKQGDGGATSDGGSCISVPRPTRLESNIEKNIFSTSAKVNNTNIHVEVNPVNGIKNVNILSDSGGSVSEERNMPMRFIIGQENFIQNTKRLNSDFDSGAISPRNSSRPKQLYTNTSLNNSDGESKVETEKHLRNVSQQCSLEYSSEIESIQLTSEQSDHNLPEIGETPEQTDQNFHCSSANEMSDLDEHHINSQFEMPKKLSYSNSLYCLPMDHLIEARNYRRSLNDIASTTSSRRCENEYSRPSLMDLQSLTSSHLYDQVHNSQQMIDRSQQSLVEENSLTSENTYTQDQDGQTYATSLMNVTNEHEFRPLTHLRQHNLDERSSLRRSQHKGQDYLGKEFNSLNDLTFLDNSISSDVLRSSQAKDSTKVCEKEGDYRNGQGYVISNTDDEVYSENSSLSGNIKKETSV
ncbi:adhesion G protein-coupled receptor A3 isoform X1 [Neodiprion pinetum]|uniref:adhesion G protein-coupled receptor A3 isoform X1 n=1 Tax=Neodiprion pinetum TaxID=441929 RepID=UPI001EDE9B0A|nr:adhesion G protein-coupled receptor A3 isoform X1 [Neodiprion pinetum]XP_046488639.1 adhesion G protein-coupled receptor A3 isoform X1 [Neodiprion pinetum]XP_046488640.1 adhesion G protein-coupled receptor A3 isoform X1 [Neodiprion pinetum]